MTKAETLTILEILQTTYPRFYQNTKSDDLKSALEIWAEIFQDDDVNLVKAAVKSLIQHLEYPPTIADVRKEIEKLMDAVQGEDTAADEWNAIKKALGNSIYNAGEMFEYLPEIAKKFVGSPQQLRQWALSENFNSDVVKGQFLKQYETLKERQKYDRMISKNPELQRLLGELSDKLLLTD